MRIGILTFHRSINYGAFMQAYALSNELRKRYGNIVEIIDFELEQKYINYRKPMFGIKNYIFHGNQYRDKYNKFRKDLELLPLSAETLITNDYDKVLNYFNKRYDIIIVGSDAVWAYNKYLKIDNPYWLFGDKLNCIKMSYAASAYSLDVKNVPESDKTYIADCLKSFSYIGVRDVETYNFIKSADPSLKINMNCDPTVLLKKPDRNVAETILKKKGVDINKRVVSIMLTGNEYIYKVQKMLGKKYEFINIDQRNYYADRFKLQRNKYLYDLSPFEWYHIYSCCFLNFTFYFHGTLLALVSHVPTLSFDKTSFDYPYISKIKQLLLDMNLFEFWFDNNIRSKAQEDLFLSKVEYAVKNNELLRKKIEENIEKEKLKSNSFFEHLSSFILCEHS